MATIVKHKATVVRFVVLGANLAKWKTARANALLGDLFPVEREGRIGCSSSAGPTA